MNGNVELKNVVTVTIKLELEVSQVLTSHLTKGKNSAILKSRRSKFGESSGPVRCEITRVSLSDPRTHIKYDTSHRSS